MHSYTVCIYTHVPEYSWLSEYWHTWLFVGFGLPGYWNVCTLLCYFVPNVWFVLWNVKDLCWLCMIHSTMNRHIGILLTQVNYELLLSCPNLVPINSLCNRASPNHRDHPAGFFGSWPLSSFQGAPWSITQLQLDRILRQVRNPEEVKLQEADILLMEEIRTWDV